MTNLWPPLWILAWSACTAMLVVRAGSQVKDDGDSGQGFAVVFSCAAAAGLAALCLASCGLWLASATCCAGLAAAALGDARTGYLFDAATVPTSIAAIAANIWAGRAHEAAMGVCSVALPAALVALASRERLLGFGDVKALFGMGAAFGSVGAATALLVASALALVYAALAGCRMRDAVRFGPFLALGSVASVGWVA